MINWLFGVNVSIYLADKFTGLTGYTLWKTYRKRKKIYRRKGIRVTSPLPGEGIKATKRRVPDRPGKLGVSIWAKDKEQIKNANVFVFPLVGGSSQGCINELVLGRGCYWKPTVYIHSKPGFITKEQNDIVVKSDQEAARYIVKKFGTRWKRMKWRLAMLNRSLLGWLWQQMKEFWI